jgi:hypothetical protein
MSSVSSNLLPFNVDLILGNKKKSGGDKSGEYGRWFNFGIPCLQKLLYWYCSVRSRVVMREEPASSFLKLRSYSTNSLNHTTQYFLFHQPKSHWTISWNQLTNCFDHVRCSFERLLVVPCVRHLGDFHGRPEILHTIKNPIYEREHCHHKPVISAGKFQWLVCPSWNKT